MSNSAARIFLVAGATRGIGLALVAEIASQDPSATIYAGGRNIVAASELKELVAKYPGRIEIVKYIAGDKEGNEALAKEIGKKHDHVDTIIANAGISNHMKTVHETPVENYEDHFAVNVLGPIVLFQAFRDLLKASTKGPQFLAISSSVGSIENVPHIPFELAAYGSSKAALNWVVRKIHYENDWLVAFPQCPGPVDTDMAREGMDASPELRQQLVNLDTFKKPSDVASILVKAFAAATREKDGGQFHGIDGGRIPW